MFSNTWYSLFLLSSSSIVHAEVTSPSVESNSVQDALKADGCSNLPINISSIGFHANFYDTPYNSSRAIDRYLILNGRELNGSLATASGVTDLSLHGEISDSTVSYGDVYGVNTTVSNFTVELTGYYQAPQSGVYEVSLDSVTPGVLMRIGSKLGGYECTGSITQDVRLPLVGYNIPSKPDTLITTSQFVKYEAGMYYPIRIIFTNLQTSYSFNLKFTLPDGSFQTKFDNVVSVDSINDGGDQNIGKAKANFPNMVARLDLKTPSSTVTEATTTLQSGQERRASFLARVDGNPLGSCSSIPAPLETGVHADFYNYPFNSTFSSNYPENGDFWFGSKYNTFGISATADGIPDASLDRFYPKWWLGEIHIPPGYKRPTGPIYETIYGMNTTVTNFTVELSGYYRAPMTGTYNFSVIYDFPGIMVRLGAKSNDTCTGKPKDDVSYDNNNLFFALPFFGVSGENYFHLEAGEYYPITIVFNSGPARAYYVLDFEIILPNGFIQTDLKDFYSLQVKKVEPSSSLVISSKSSSSPVISTKASKSSDMKPSSVLSTITTSATLSSSYSSAIPFITSVSRTAQISYHSQVGSISASKSESVRIRDNSSSVITSFGYRSSQSVSVLKLQSNSVDNAYGNASLTNPFPKSSIPLPTTNTGSMRVSSIRAPYSNTSCVSSATVAPSTFPVFGASMVSATGFFQSQTAQSTHSILSKAEHSAPVNYHGNYGVSDTSLVISTPVREGLSTKPLCSITKATNVPTSTSLNTPKSQNTYSLSIISTMQSHSSSSKVTSYRALAGAFSNDAGEMKTSEIMATESSHPLLSTSVRSQPTGNLGEGYSSYPAVSNSAAVSTLVSIPILTLVILVQFL